MKIELGNKLATEFDISQLESELAREQYKTKFRKLLGSTINSLIVVAAIAVLVAMMFLPVLKISGESMQPTLNNSELVMLFKVSKFKRGDLCSFAYQNKLLVKRIIGVPGDYVSIDEDGYVYINGTKIDEPYVQERSIGECDMVFPYQVPEKQYFVMGDHRSTSVDSRCTVIGCISTDQIVGKIVLRVWPLKRISIIH